MGYSTISFSGSGSWNAVSLWGRNLTDDDSLVYAAYRTAFGSAGHVGMYQQPRTYGVTLDYAF